MRCLRTTVLGALALLVAATTSQAFGGRSLTASRGAYSMPVAPVYQAYMPAYAPTVYAIPYAPTWHCPLVWPLPAAHMAIPVHPWPAQPWPAQPRPAPPSGMTSPSGPPRMGETMEPPLSDPKAGKRGPAIIESRSQYAEGQPSSLKNRLQVGFWNVSGKDVKLRVGDRDYTLLNNRAITVELERRFAWQVGQREAVTENVPSGQGFYEVIIRD